MTLRLQTFPANCALLSKLKAYDDIENGDEFNDSHRLLKYFEPGTKCSWQSAMLGTLILDARGVPSLFAMWRFERS